MSSRDECRCKGCGLPNEYCYILQKGMCGTNAELSNAWATAERAEEKNKRLLDGIQEIITTHYPVMYDNDKVGLALVALLNYSLKDGE